MGLLIECNPLSAKQKDHKLIGNFTALGETNDNYSNGINEYRSKKSRTHY